MKFPNPFLSKHFPQNQTENKFYQNTRRKKKWRSFQNLVKKAAKGTGHHDEDQPKQSLYCVPPATSPPIKPHSFITNQKNANQAISALKEPPAREVLRPPPHIPPPTTPRAVAASMSEPHLPPPPPLYKQRSWSPDAYRDEAWHRRKKINGRSNLQRSKSVTDEDLDELKACIELGFGFDSPVSDKRLADTLPALGLYYAVNKNYCDSVSNKSTATPTSSFSPTPSECEAVTSPIDSPHTIIGPGDTPQTVKTRLRQWAQVVACTVRQGS